MEKEKYQLAPIVYVLTLLLLLSQTASITAAGATDDRDWSMFRGGPKHLGSRGPSVPGTGEILWSVLTGGAGEGFNDVFSSPAVSDGTVYVGSMIEALFAIDLKTGDVEWRHDADDFIHSSPSVVGGTVYFGSDGGRVYAVDAENGQLIWRLRVEGDVESSPAVHEDTLYVGTGGSYGAGHLYAIDVASGETNWKYKTSGVVASSPTVRQGIVVFGCCRSRYEGRNSPGSVIALDANSSEKLWEVDTPKDVISSPAIVEGTVYIGTEEGNVLALDLETGAEQWSFSTRDAVWSSPAVYEGTLYVGSLDANLYALDAETGTEIWSYTANKGILSSPAVTNKAVYFTTRDNTVYSVDRSDGSLVWKKRVVEDQSSFSNKFVRSSPAVVNGVLVVGSDHESFTEKGTVWGFDVAPNQPPTASIEIESTGLKVDGEGFTSSDPDGSITSYKWDWGDGTTSTGQVDSHIYARNGTFLITLTVTDNKGAKNSTAVEVNITNQPPQAEFTFRPSEPTTGDTVRFTDESTDVDGEISIRQWTIRNDAISGEETPEYVFQEADTVGVTLRVSDNHNASDSVSKTFNVVERVQTTPGVNVSSIVALLGVYAVVLWRRN